MAARSQDLGFRLTTGAFAAALALIVLGVGVELVRQSWLSIDAFGFDA